MVRTISNKSNESNEYERTRIKVRSFVANGYSLRIAPCSDDSFDIRPCSLIIYSNGLKFGRFVRCPSLSMTQGRIMGYLSYIASDAVRRGRDPVASWLRHTPPIPIPLLAVF